MSVRAKFRCTLIEPNGETVNTTLEPVISGSKENEQFFKRTPSGQIRLCCVNADANKQFEVGKEFYVDFTEAEPAKE